MYTTDLKQVAVPGEISSQDFVEVGTRNSDKAGDYRKESLGLWSQRGRMIKAFVLPKFCQNDSNPSKAPITALLPSYFRHDRQLGLQPETENGTDANVPAITKETTGLDTAALVCHRDSLETGINDACLEPR